MKETAGVGQDNTWLYGFYGLSKCLAQSRSENSPAIYGWVWSLAVVASFDG